MRSFFAAALVAVVIAVPRAEASPSPGLPARGTVNVWEAGSTAVVLALAPLGAPPPKPPVTRKPRAASVSSRPAPTVQHYSGACSGWLSTVVALWPASQVPEACHVLGCESQGNPRAHNASGASGLFQLMPIHAGRFAAHGWSWADVYDGAKNAVVAHDLWASAGWAPWSCR